MNPGLVVKLRPSGPWRIGPDSGARNRVDVIYHSDSLYSAVTAAMSRMGWLEEWLDATARIGSPAVSFSSCFPFLGDVVFVVPPRTVWPPASPSTKAARVRWKSARFVPLTVVQSILAGQRIDENMWSVDGPSDCLVPAGKPGPFRTAVRSNAGVDRLTGSSDRHSTACIEFRAGSGLWTVVSFLDESAHEKWSSKVKAAFRLLADTGFGGERSRGWGRSEAPEFTDGMLPDLILPLPTESTAATVEPEIAEAAVMAVSPIAPLIVEPQSTPPHTEPEAPAGKATVAEAETPRVPEPVAERAADTTAPGREPEAPAVETNAPATETPAVADPSAEPEVPAAAAVAAEPETPAAAEPVAEPAASAVEASESATETPAAEAEVPAEAVAAEPETPAATAPVAEPGASAVEANASATETPAAEPEVPAAAAVAAAPETPAVAEPGAPEAQSAAAEPDTSAVAEPVAETAAEATAPEPETSAVAEPAAEPEAPVVAVAAAAGSDAADAEAVVTEPEPLAVETIAAPEPQAPLVEATPEPEPTEALPTVPTVPTHPHWLLSLFTPAAADSVDWRRGNYTVLPRGGRIDSPAGSGELKKQIQMVAEGSVLYAETAPRGSAADVAPDGFAHPVFRAGFAVAIPLPEVR